MVKVNQSINLLQWYYHFLYLGKFLENIIQHNDLSDYAQDIPIPTWPESSFTMKGQTIKNLLQQIHKHPDKKNLFGFMVEINAWRWVCGTMRELLLDRDDFQRFVQQRLSDQYFAFEQVIIFVRNILTHSIDSAITLEQDGITGQKNYLADRSIHRVGLDFSYADHISSWTGSKNYGVKITIDFRKLRAGTSLLKVIDSHQLYMLGELCYNLCTLYKQYKVGNKPKRKK